MAQLCPNELSEAGKSLRLSEPRCPHVSNGGDKNGSYSAEDMASARMQNAKTGPGTQPRSTRTTDAQTAPLPWRSCRAAFPSSLVYL